MDFDVLIIGAGVIGLATAENLSRKGLRILVVEKASRIGTGISSRNSEVIHAGIYYPKGSLKAELCLRGRQLLYDWCASKNIAHANIGKYIIASSHEELEKLESLRINAEQAGLTELYYAGKDELKVAEPNVKALGALYSPTTGIVSAHELMESLKVAAENRGVDILFMSEVKNVSKNSDSSGYVCEIRDTSGDLTEIETAGVVNCAGLYADEVSKLLNTFEAAYEQKFVKGNYFRLSAQKGLFNHLVYPVPMPKMYGLGIHVTIDLNGGLRFGPDSQEISDKTENYDVDEMRRHDFAESIRTYYPALEEERLTPDMSGIRPVLVKSNGYNDFIIREETPKGWVKIINCVGIESPGLTAALAIGEYISNSFFS